MFPLLSDVIETDQTFIRLPPAIKPAGLLSSCSIMAHFQLSVAARPITICGGPAIAIVTEIVQNGEQFVRSDAATRDRCRLQHV